MYFYSLGFHPFGATWGGAFKPTEVCQALTFCAPGGGLPTPAPSIIAPCITPTPNPTHGNPHDTPIPTVAPTKPGKPSPSIVFPIVNQTGQASAPTGIALVAMFPLFAPLITMLIGRRFKPTRPKRKRN